jgi:rhodanese-related sulfurtransferase
MLKQISVKELAERLQAETPPILIDVREPDEYAYAHIDGAAHKPLGDIFSWADELDKGKEYVLLCHSGSRSMQATMLLQQMGFTNVSNVIGGIDAWSVHVDPRMPRY